MIVKMFPALPLFTKDEQSLFKGICVEFVPGTSRLCTNKGNNLFHLLSEILTMVPLDTTPGCNK